MSCSTSFNHVAAIRRRVLAGLAAAAFLALAAGCQTVPREDEDEDDSDLPWNAQQPWEMAPSIPGMSGNGGF